jgi:CO/xanthine dehydrogenase FAD-binding subunit
MILSSFDYHSPAGIQEASRLLLEEKNSMILAGGTDLLVKMRKGGHRPVRLVDVKKIPGLFDIHWEDGSLFVGACVTWSTIKGDDRIREDFPALHQSSLRFGCHEIRNRATLGGNVCSASPGAESGGPLAVYGASVKIHGPQKERVVPFSSFVTGPGRVSLEPGEVVTGVLLPKQPQGAVSAYRRTARVKGQDLATCAITVMAIDPANPPRREIRVALSAVMKTPARADGLEKILSGRPITPGVLAEAKAWLQQNLYPRASSLRGTPDYKKQALGGMLEILLGDLGLLER